MEQDAVTIKAQLGNHFRRFTVPLHATQTQQGGYYALVSSVRKVFGIGPRYAVRLAYVDDEEDWIVVSSQEEFWDGARRFAVGSEDAAEGKSLRVRVEIVELPPSFSPTSFVPLNPMESSLYASLDVSIMHDHIPASPVPGPDTLSTVDPPPDLVVEYVSAVMDGSSSDFVRGGCPSADTAPSTEGDLNQQPPAQLPARNEFHLHRQTIQSAITQTMDTLFADVQSEPNSILNQPVFRRIIVVTAIESAFRFLFSNDVSLGNEAKTRRARRSIDAIREKLLVVPAAVLPNGVESLVRPIHEKSVIVSAAIVHVFQEVGDRRIPRTSNSPPSALARPSVAMQVTELARSVVGGLASVLTEVGERMGHEDPFGGMGMRRKFSELKVPPRKSSLRSEGPTEKEPASTSFKEGIMNSVGGNSADDGGKAPNDEAEQNGSVIDMESVDGSAESTATASNPPAERAERSDDEIDVAVVDPSLPACDLPGPSDICKLPVTKSPADSVMSSSLSSTASIATTTTATTASHGQQISSPVTQSSSHTLSHAPIHSSPFPDFPTHFTAADLMLDSEPINLEIGDDVSDSESDMSRVPDVDAASTSEESGGLEQHQDERADSDDGFVLIEDDDEDEGLKSSILVFPVM